MLCGSLPMVFYRAQREPYNAPMPDLPVMLRLADKPCVIVGGGGVALRRLHALLACGATVTVIAPEVGEEIEALVGAGRCVLLRRSYLEGDLTGAMLVIIATDDPATNEAVAIEARRRGVLVNRTDASDLGDLTIPAHIHRGPVTLTAHTAGISAAAAATILKQTSEALDPAWPALLEIVAPYRAKVQGLIADRGERRRRLVSLTDADALALFKHDGANALRQRCEALLASVTGE